METFSGASYLVTKNIPAAVRFSPELKIPAVVRSSSEFNIPAVVSSEFKKVLE